MKLASIVVAVAVGILTAEGARIKNQVDLAEQDNQDAASKAAENQKGAQVAFERSIEIEKQIQDIVVANQPTPAQEKEAEMRKKCENHEHRNSRRFMVSRCIREGLAAQDWADAHCKDWPDTNAPVVLGLTIAQTPITGNCLEGAGLTHYRPGPGQCKGNPDVAKSCPCACSQKFKEAMDLVNAAAEHHLNDPEYQKKMNAIAEEALDEVKEKSEGAAKAVGDHEVQRWYTHSALNAVAQAREAAEQGTAALTDPELQKLYTSSGEAYTSWEAALEKLTQAQAAAEQAAADNANRPEIRDLFLEQAAAAKEAAANLKDPELQKKMKEIAENNLANVKADAGSATKALNDPEAQRQFQHMALDAIAGTRATAEQAIEDLTDPKLREEALKTLKQVQAGTKNVQRDAEQAAAECEKKTEMREKCMEQVQKVRDQIEATQKAIQKAIEKDVKNAAHAAEQVAKETRTSAYAAELVAKALPEQAAIEKDVKNAAQAAEQAAKDSMSAQNTPNFLSLLAVVGLMCNCLCLPQLALM